MVVATICGACLLAGLAYVLLSPRSYETSAMLLVDSTAPDPVSGEKSDAARNSKVVMSTHADLVQTPVVALGAAQLSGLAAEPALVQSWKQSTGERVPFQQWIAGWMLRAIVVEPKRDTNVLLITAHSADPNVAARIANGFAQSALNTQYRLRTDPAKSYATWLETRLQAAQADVREKQQRLSQFARASGIADGDLSAESTQMASIATQLAEAQARAAAARQSGDAGTQSAADVERSGTVQKLRQDISERTAKVAELESAFGPRYPELKRTRAELQQLQAELNSEVGKSRAAFAAARNAEAAAARAAASASEGQLRASASQQRARLSGLSSNLAQYATLRNEFEAAQRSFNDINERLLKMRLQGAVPETEVKIVNVAAAPLLPSSPKVGFIMAAALILGLLLGAAFAILLESLNPRVRSGPALERLLGVRVIGRVRIPELPQRRLSLAGGVS
jgi:uncharacterized protein involved in exopolysaccharide biosynthesis